MSVDDWENQQIDRVSSFDQRLFIGSGFAQSAIGANTWSVNEPLNKHVLDRLLQSVQRPYKHDQTTTVGQIGIGDDLYVLKRYNARSFGHRIKRALRRSRAQRCWCMSYQYQRAGLKVAAPMLMLESRFGPIRSDAYFINRYLNGEELLSMLPKASAEQQALIAAAVENAFSKMKKYRLSHGDLKASNLMWVDEQLYFIDLDAARIHKSDLSWQAAHRKDRKRFFKNWQDNPQVLAIFTAI